MKIYPSCGFGHRKMNIELIEIPKATDHSAALQAGGAWWKYGDNAGTQVAIFVCPFCQNAGQLNGPESNHTIAADGTVNPSVRCDCNKFHAYIKLLDYGK